MPRFCAIYFQKMYRKLLFWKQWGCYQNDNYQLVVPTSMKHFNAASFSIKPCFYEISNIFYLER